MSTMTSPMSVERMSPLVRAEATISDGGDIAAKRWYVARIHPHAEDRASFHLKRQDYEVFCPRLRKTVRHARKKKDVLAPLFPGYLFVELNLAFDRWRSINGTYGVAGLIAWRDTPEPVRVGAVEALKTRTDRNGVMDFEDALKIGQNVRIFDGPFADLVGVLSKLDSAGRVSVLLELFGRSVSVTLRQEALTAAT